MGVFGGSRPEYNPVGSFTYIVGLDLVGELLSSHMAAVKFEIEKSTAKNQDGVGACFEAQVFHESIAAGKQIFPQAVSESDVVLDMIVIQGGPGARSQGVTGIEIMVEFLKADFLALDAAHTTELGCHNGVIAPFVLSGKKVTDISGGRPFHFGNELPDD